MKCNSTTMELPKGKLKSMQYVVDFPYKIIIYELQFCYINSKNIKK